MSWRLLPREAVKLRTSSARVSDDDVTGEVVDGDEMRNVQQQTIISFKGLLRNCSLASH